MEQYRQEQAERYAREYEEMDEGSEEESEEDSEEEEKHFCEICNKAFNNANQLTNHEKSKKHK